MITISRSEALDEMLLGIYGNRNVNFENQKVIINDDRIRKTLYSPTSATNLRKLFEVTFKNPDVIFEDKKKGKNFTLNKEMVITNTVNYFSKLGIDIPEVVNSTERTLLGMRMCDAILEHILPAIFNNTNTEKGKFDIENADISLEFNKAIESIQSKFCSGDFFEQLYVDIKSSDVEKLYDSDYSIDECNYGLCVCSYLHSVFYVFKPVPSIYYYAHRDKLVLDKNLSNLNDLCDDYFNAPIQSANSFERLTERFINKAALENKNFINPYYYNINQINFIDKTMHWDRVCQLSFNSNIPNHSFIPRHFYFMTKLNETIIKEKYPECESSIALDFTLKDKAIEQINTEYAEKIAKYYVDSLANIKNVCSKFLAIDIETILSQKITDCTGFKKTLSLLCNENEIDTVWAFCHENKLNAKQSSRYIYCGIEDAIWVYLHYITSLTKLIDEEKLLYISIERYFSSKKFLKLTIDHTRTLAELLTKSKIDSLIELREKHKNFTWSTNAGSNLDYYIEGHEQRVDKGEQNIYRFMQNSITDYCAALRNAVNRD